MFYIGIDIAKNEHCACVIDHSGEVFIEPFFFNNNLDGFKLFLDKTKDFINQDHILGLEATGHYGDTLIKYLLDNNFYVGVINPLVTDAFRKSKVRKTKTDKIDAFIICKVLISGDFSTMTSTKFNNRQAKQLTRFHATLSQDLNIHKNRLQKCLDIVFPEFNSFFKTKYSKAYMAILKEFGSAFNVANAHLTKLKNTLNIKARGAKTYDYKAFKELASNSVGEDNPNLVLEIKFLISSIELIISQLDEVDKKIEELADNSKSPIFTISGIGAITGMSILSEIGDINLFSNCSKLIGFAGVDPATYQSGNFNAGTTAISKRGSTYLRKRLYQCILTVVKYNPIFNKYYTLKRNQGKSHRCAQGHCVRKILRVIFKLLSENIEFNETKLV